MDNTVRNKMETKMDLRFTRSPRVGHINSQKSGKQKKQTRF